MPILATISRIIATLSDRATIDRPMADSDEVAQLFEAYQKAKQSGDVALAEILRSKWLVATADL